jgi:hypothetical protein
MVNIDQNSAIFILRVTLIGDAAAGKTSAEANYTVAAFITPYNGTLKLDPLKIPYREKVALAASPRLLTVGFGKSPSTLPGETAKPSPFGNEVVTFKYILDHELAKTSPTAELIGFGQASKPGSPGQNLSVYNVAEKDRLLVTHANLAEVRVLFVLTNGNVPKAGGT